MSRLPCALDISRLLMEYSEHVACPSLLAFRFAWKSLDFGRVIEGIMRNLNRKGYMGLLYTTALGYLLVNDDFNTKIFSLFLIYFLYEIRGEEDQHLRVPLSPELRRELLSVYHYGIRNEIAEIVQIIHKLTTDNAFELHATCDIGHVSDYLRVRDQTHLDDSWTPDSPLDDTPLLADMMNPTTLQHVLSFPDMERSLQDFDRQLHVLTQMIPTLDTSVLNGSDDFLTDLMDIHTNHQRQLKGVIADFDRKRQSLVGPVSVVFPTRHAGTSPLQELCEPQIPALGSPTNRKGNSSSREMLRKSRREPFNFTDNGISCVGDLPTPRPSHRRAMVFSQPSRRERFRKEIVPTLNTLSLQPTTSFALPSGLPAAGSITKSGRAVKCTVLFDPTSEPVTKKERSTSSPNSQPSTSINSKTSSLKRSASSKTKSSSNPSSRKIRPFSILSPFAPPIVKSHAKRLLGSHPSSQPT